MADFDDLVDTTEIAEMLGLASFRVVSVYRARYADFPSPVVDKPRAKLWLRADIEAWLGHRRG